MKSFLTFTLAAGVAITTASVAQAAGVTRVDAKSDRTASQSMASIGGPTVGIGFDRMTLNRELTRLTDLLQPASADDSLVDEGSVVGRKTGQAWSF